MKHDPEKMQLADRYRQPFKNYLVKKSYWINVYECATCHKKTQQLNNFLRGFDLICNGEKIIKEKRQ